MKINILNKNKYLNLRQQIGFGVSILDNPKLDCNNEVVFNNIIGTCWMVSIQMILVFGDATREILNQNLKQYNVFDLYNNDSKKYNFINIYNTFIRQEILKYEQSKTNNEEIKKLLEELKITKNFMIINKLKEDKIKKLSEKKKMINDNLSSKLEQEKRLNLYKDLQQINRKIKNIYRPLQSSQDILPPIIYFKFISYNIYIYNDYYFYDDISGLLLVTLNLIFLYKFI